MPLDTQNVHDPVLAQHVRTSYQSLPEPSGMDLGECLREIRAHIRDHPVALERDRALRTLDRMEMGTQDMTYVDGKEVDVLHRVWPLLTVSGDAAATAERRTLLVHRLAEADGVCTSGRVARVLDTLSGLDDRVRLRSKFILRRELLDKAARLAADPATKRPLLPTLREVFYRDYVMTGLVPVRILDEELHEWGEHIE